MGVCMRVFVQLCLYGCTYVFVCWTLCLYGCVYACVCLTVCLCECMYACVCVFGVCMRVFV